MTTTMTPARPRKAAIRGGQQLAGRILATRSLPPGADTSRIAAAIGKALALTSPTEPHGQVLAGVLRDKPPQDRTPAEHAAWWLALRGQTPTEGAVAGRLAEADSQRQRVARHRQAADMLARRDGARAARQVAEVIAITGSGPTWRELARALGWPESAAAAVIRRMVAAGWLTVGEEPRSLRPARHERGAR